MTVTKAFANTTIALEKSMAEIDKMLGAHNIRESRHTHRRPERAPARANDRAPETIGTLVYEFVYPGKAESERRGVRIAVSYQPEYTEYTKPKGTTAEMAARALFWFLKAKFDSIDYGIEAFDVAFMPHLVTAIGTTFAESPALIVEATQRPESIALLALPAPTAVRS